MNKYRVWLRSVPGPYEQYDGCVVVWADDSEDAKVRAKRQLRLTSFPDRHDSMWRVEKIEMM